MREIIDKFKCHDVVMMESGHSHDVVMTESEKPMQDKIRLDKKEHGSSGDKPNAKKDYPEEFEWIWSNKPEREGANPKRKAYQACSARNKQGASWREMAEGMKRYKEYCEKSKIIGTRMVQQMATFFGPDEHFKNEWEVSGGSTKGVENPQTPKYVEIDKQKAIRELEDL